MSDGDEKLFDWPDPPRAREKAPPKVAICVLADPWVFMARVKADNIAHIVRNDAGYGPDEAKEMKAARAKGSQLTLCGVYARPIHVEGTPRVPACEKCAMRAGITLPRVALGMP